MLNQSEKTVEALTDIAGIDIKLTSAHLREAQLINMRREGRFMYDRLSGHDVAEMLIKVRDVAGAHLTESPLAKARTGDIVIIDVRPAYEYATAHPPCARSMPLAELEQRIKTLSPAVPIVAYCRGP